MSTKRIPCPHCGESILPDAKKCRFCGERLDTRKKSPSLRTLYWAWFLSMAVFFTAMFFVRRAPVSSASFWLVVLGSIVLGGIIAYLMLMVKVLGSLKAKNAKWYGLAMLVTFIAFFGLLFNYETIEAKLGFTPPQVEQSASQATVTPVPSISPIPTNKPVQRTTPPKQSNSSNQVTCTGPDGKSFKTTQTECDNFNQAWGNVEPPSPNEMIRCNIHPDCGGGYKEMTRSSCEQMTCCLTSLSSSPKFTSKSECSRQVNQNCADQVSATYSRDVAFCTKHIGENIGYDCMESANRLRDQMMAICNQ